VARSSVMLGILFVMCMDGTCRWGKQAFCRLVRIA
jgi:hypothetical protein